MLLTAAFSITEKLDKYDNYAGFAALVGLAVLALLYFAQAREVKRLREWAGRAPERDQELRESVTSRANVVRAQTPVASSQAPSQGVPGGLVGQSGIEATAVQQKVGAQTPSPGLGGGSAATPPGSPVPGTPGTPTPDDQPTQAIPALPNQPVTAAGAAQSQPSVKPALPTGGVRSGAVGSAGTTAGAAVGTTGSTPPQAGAASPGVAASTSGGGAKPSVTGATPPPAPTVRRQQQSRTAGGTSATRHSQSASTSRSFFLPLLVLGALAVGAGGYLLAVNIFGDDGGDVPSESAQTTEKSSSTDRGGSSSRRRQGPVVRSKTTVAVLNGTTSVGLAAQTADQIEGAGFKRGTVATNTDQQRLTTTVYYKRGYKREAREAARVIGVSDLKPVDSDTQALAGQDAVVVVITGADKTP